jgi:nucleoside-diphosphate-sugar epimerase
VTLLVTGAAGHVGLALTRAAVKAGLKVVGVVRSLERIDAVTADEFGPAVTWAVCDLADAFQIAAVAAEHRVEACVHAAAVPNDRLARPFPWAAVQANVCATGALLELARRQGWRRFVYVSTGSVFQTATEFDKPILEDAVTSAHTVYGSTKRAGELLTRMYRNDFGLSASSVRISFVYGPPLAPRQRDLPRGPITAFVREAVLGQAIREPSGGDFQASFTYIDDVAEGLLAAVKADRLRHDIYHLGNGRNWTTFDVADAVRAAVPGAIVEVGPGSEPWTTYNTMRGPLAGSRLHDDTGFTARFPLERGVEAFADWMQASGGRRNEARTAAGHKA